MLLRSLQHLLVWSGFVTRTWSGISWSLVHQKCGRILHKMAPLSCLGNNAWRMRKKSLRERIILAMLLVFMLWLVLVMEGGGCSTYQAQSAMTRENSLQRVWSEFWSIQIILMLTGMSLFLIFIRIFVSLSIQLRTMSSFSQVNKHLTHLQFLQHL